MTTWTKDQQKRLRDLAERDDAWIGYWCSDSWGRSANGGSTDAEWHAEPGAVQTIDDDLELSVCPSREGEGGLHATDAPHKWQGDRVWFVALIGKTKVEDEKRAAKKREIVGEVRPSDVVFDPRLAARMELKDLPMCGADLLHADLRDADLRGADLRNANLRCADLRGADLGNAHLGHANLQDTDLRNVNLRDANLKNTDLQGAHLGGAYLGGAYLGNADLRDADLRDAYVNPDQIDVAITNNTTRLPTCI